MYSLLDPKSLDLVEDSACLEEMLGILHSFAADLDTTFQIDFITSGETVVRVRTSNRSWKKIASGSWNREHILELIGRGLVTKKGTSSMGWEIKPRPEMLGAL